MARPESLEHGVVFDPTAIDREMRTEVAYERGTHTARTLVHAADLRIVLIALKAGGRMAEHRADGSVSIHALSGRVRLELPDRAVELSAGQLLALESGLRHDVEAVTDAAILLTIAWGEAR